MKITASRSKLAISILLPVETGHPMIRLSFSMQEDAFISKFAKPIFPSITNSLLRVKFVVISFGCVFFCCVFGSPNPGLQKFGFLLSTFFYAPMVYWLSSHLLLAREAKESHPRSPFCRVNTAEFFSFFEQNALYKSLGAASK